ncbi:MAG TPA: hypothetical protein VLX68_16175 [Chitinivibrionales bacterium]|nr:hypothetical protein [Chitinivibrionales bacterium]
MNKKITILTITYISVNIAHAMFGTFLSIPLSIILCVIYLYFFKKFVKIDTKIRKTFFNIFAILMFFFSYGEFGGIPFIRQYLYETSDGKFMAMEMPGKGRNLDIVYWELNKYKRCVGDSTTSLYRTSKRNLFIIPDWLPNKRWDIPYKSPSGKATSGNPCNY